MATAKTGIALLAVAVAVGCARDADDAGGVGAAAAEGFAFDTAMRTSAIVRSDTEAMLDALSRIEGWHRLHQAGRIVASAPPRLRAGASVAQLDALEAELGCHLPEEARALWRWRDGQDGIGDGSPLVWYHDVLPLARALEEYRELRAVPWSGWDASWFPVLYFQEEWYFVECTAERAEASPVGHYFVEDAPGLAYANLTTYFATAAEALAAGAAAAPEAADTDVAALAAIHARHNPGIPFPYAVPEEVR